jgi:hypothetical protein
MVYVATCRHCGRTIVQHPSGTWVPRDGTVNENPYGVYCQKLPDRRPDMFHEPMPSGLTGAPQLTSPHAMPASHGCERANALVQDYPPQRRKSAASKERG